MIGERLRAARGRSRKTLRDVAQACGCSAQAVKKWEDDTAMPSSSKLITICRILNVSVEWLFDGPLDFRSTGRAPQGVHAKYWVREAIEELKEQGIL
ncbi:MAG: helix-turn-helix transcriptional regulator [Roseovarius sp.]|nr:helix-turn-helix transcriptional regulator [Roseovarius sp.]